jgi:hypothetical protein
LDHQIAFGKLLSAGWDAAGAFLARHHIDGWVDGSLLAVVHGHGRRISEYLRRVIHRCGEPSSISPAAKQSRKV